MVGREAVVPERGRMRVLLLPSRGPAGVTDVECNEGRPVGRPSSLPPY
jgi:hypothetical protein